MRLQVGVDSAEANADQSSVTCFGQKSPLHLYTFDLTHVAETSWKSLRSNLIDMAHHGSPTLTSTAAAEDAHHLHLRHPQPNTEASGG